MSKIPLYYNKFRTNVNQKHFTMNYKNFQTFTAEQKGGILTIDINFGPVKVQGQDMLADLSSLCSGKTFPICR